MVSSKWSIDRFVQQLSTADAVPGGGSVAAVTGACGAALGVMVARIVLARPKTTVSAKKQLRDSVMRLQRASKALKRLVEADAKCFAALMKAYGQHKKKGDAASERTLARARKAAIKAPLDICVHVADSLKVLRKLEGHAGEHLMSDVHAARAFLKSSFEAAFATAQMNFTSRLTATEKQLKQRLQKLNKEVKQY